jgi:hypothetical protein
MRGIKKFDIGIIIVSAIFAIWFFGKSLGYDAGTGSFWVARNQVGDFGLHLSLIRSFSLGNNFPPQSPFFSGTLLSYHYLFDLLSGLLARAGMRIDTAYNFLSVIALVALLYGIYALSQRIFGNNRRVGILSVLLFLSPGGWSFVDFFRQHNPGAWLSGWWRLPDYIHSGPFDGSVYSIYFTLNVFLNQRHLVAALAISVWLLNFWYQGIWLHKKTSWRYVFISGIGLGVLCWMHSLVCIGSVVTMAVMGLMKQKRKDLLMLSAVAGVIALPRIFLVSQLPESHPWWNPGVFIPGPKTLLTWVAYWWSNMGLLSLLIPAGVILAVKEKRWLWWGIFPVFVAANIIQFSYRTEHNHSLFNYFFLLANMYGAYILDRIWKARLLGKTFFCILVMLIGLNGLLQLAVIKNDFHFPVPDVRSDPFMAWIVKYTPKQSIFVSPASLIDPVTLSGRYSYVGPSYYLDVMGYNSSIRRSEIKKFLEHPDNSVVQTMGKRGVGYVVVPFTHNPDYPYIIDTSYFASHLRQVYSDNRYTVYAL